jgi:DNA (cytosine-5)-methyltransferase 1
MNYKVEFKVLSAADFGGATTRRRLFILARKKGKRIVWPAQTHAKEVKSEDIFLNLKPWRTAREIIDWKNRGHSIFGRKKPLAASTIDRIAAGIRRFCHPQLIQPFLVMLYGTNDVRSVDLPAPTVTAEGQHIALAQPFILAPLGIGRGNAPRSVDQPTPTILATRGGGHIVEPFIITPGGADLGVGRPVSSPLPTVTGSDRFAVVDPFIIPFYGEREGQEARKHGVDEPLPTQPCSNKFGLAKPFVLQQQSGGAPRATDQPLPTIVGKGAQELVQPFITDVRHADQRIHSPDAPLPTLTGKAGHAIVEPYLVKYNSSGDGKDPHSVDKPIGTITARDRFALVTPDGRYELDIYFRMLTVAELAAAMGFKDYKFTGTKSDQVRQIGNAVEVNMAKALIKKLLI